MKIDHESAEPPPQAVSRIGLYLPTGLLVALGLAWSGFWLYSSRLAETSVEHWIAAEAAHGRIWSCADREISGYPFRIELNCSSISLDGALGGSSVHMTSGRMHAATQVYAPKLILADFSGPFKIESADSSTEATWDSLRASIRLSNKLERLSIVTQQPRAAVNTNAGDRYGGDAKSSELHIRYDPNRPDEDRAIDIAFSLAQANLPALSSLTGSTSKVDLSVSGAATKALDIHPQRWRDMMETWRRAGGVFLVENGQIKKGDLDVRGKGLLQLDDSRRVQGRLDVNASGIGPLLTSITGGSSLNQLVLPLLQRKDGTPVQWPVRLQDGRIQIGPLRSGPVLAPIY